MGCSPSKLHDLPAVALCRDRCNSMEETLRRSYALADAHAAYLLSLNSIGPTLHRFFDQAVEFPPVDDSEPEESPEASSPESSSSSAHSVSSSDSDLPPKFDEGTKYDLFRCPRLESLNPNHEPFYCRSYESGTRSPPPPPPASSNYGWDFINFFESYEFQRHEKDTLTKNTQKKKVTISRNEEKTKAEEAKKNLKISEKKTNKSRIKKCCTKESKDQKVSSDFSQVTKQLQEMFKKASESGNDVLKMFDTSRFRYYHHKISVYQAASSNILYAKKMMTPFDLPKPVEDFGSSFNNLSSTLKKLFMWEKKLYQEVKAEEKLRTSHMKSYKQLRRLEQKSTDLSKIEATRSSIQCLSTRMRVSIHKINNICLTINKLRDEELWSQMKELIHRLSEMWSSMLESHSRQSKVIAEAKKFDKMTLKENLDISQLELAMEMKLELRNWSQSLSNWIDSQDQYVKALNSWLMRCLKQEPHEPTPDLSEEPPLFGAINSWSQTLERTDGEKEFTEAVYTILMRVNHQVEKQRMELEEQRNVNGGVKDIERKLVTLEKEEQKMQRKMKTIPSIELTESLNLKSNMEHIFKSMEKLATNSKQTYEELNLLCT
ncbi:Protein ALTERED PHOSPHATE STARVATION RESPONSE 1 [Cardamine amara subsp. amara]|uniref:Protein ALTERED PHOSPHATE STARVATION RESPONSE 1 n=1 Tax=Cardamine amara subsp. amara TaxID=228776 RepID=A0ABD1BBT0_CARAN